MPPYLVVVLADAEAAQKPLWQRLDELTRGRIVLALVGLILLGFLLVFVTVAGGAIIRRIARQRPPPRKRELSDWDRKQPVEESQDKSDGGNRLDH